VLASILILVNLLIGSSLAGQCQRLRLKGFPGDSLNGPWSKALKRNGKPKTRDEHLVYENSNKDLFMFRFKENGEKYWAIGPKLGGKGFKKQIVMKRPGSTGVDCEDCDFEQAGVEVPGLQTVGCAGRGKLMMARAETDASAMMEADAVTEESASGLSSGDFMMMAAGAAIGALLVAVAVAVVVAMRKRKSAKRTEMEMTEAVHVPDSSVMTPDATEKKAEGDEEAVTVHSSHVAEVTVSVSMDDEAVQVDA